MDAPGDRTRVGLGHTMERIDATAMIPCNLPHLDGEIMLNGEPSEKPLNYKTSKQIENTTRKRLRTLIL